VTAILIKVTDLEFDNMLAIGVGIMITGQTAQTKRISEKEPADFWIEVRYKINNTYLTNKTNTINQKICSTTALLVSTMNYLCPVSDSNERKHILALEKILLLFMYINNKNTNNQEINIPWLSQDSRATPRTPQKDHTILFQMGLATLSSPSSILQTALNSNPIPSSTEQTLSDQEA
ncbi:3932_t:CDS:2, partial [Gigaspora margarita]